jgi:hypothetical protein
VNGFQLSYDIVIEKNNLLDGGRALRWSKTLKLLTTDYRRNRSSKDELSGYLVQAKLIQVKVVKTHFSRFTPHNKDEIGS